MRVVLVAGAFVVGWALGAGAGWWARPPFVLVGGVGLLGAVAWGVLTFSRTYYRRIAPVWDEEFPVAGRARVASGGSFTWEPVGVPRIAARHGLVHRWWDAERGARFDARVVFDVPDGISEALLHKATKRGLAAAARALPGRGKVRASAARRDDPGPMSTVSIRLVVQGVGAEPVWAAAASEAFAAAFLAVIERVGALPGRGGP